jgi:transcriptional regulator with XRE-family HTH domain
MRDQREIVRAAADSSGMSRREISKAIGKNPGYLSNYLSGKFEKLGAREIMKLTKLLGIEKGLLASGDETVETGVPHSDAKIYEPEPGDAISRQPHTVYLRVTSAAMDDHSERIEPGQIAAFDSRVNDARKLKTGMIVYAERRRGKQSDILIRQFMAPDKLVTNSSASNEVIRIDDDIAIKGAFLYVFRGLGGG